MQNLPRCGTYRGIPARAARSGTNNRKNEPMKSENEHGQRQLDPVRTWMGPVRPQRKAAAVPGSAGRTAVRPSASGPTAMNAVPAARCTVMAHTDGKKQRAVVRTRGAGHSSFNAAASGRGDVLRLRALL